MNYAKKIKDYCERMDIHPEDQIFIHEAVREAVAAEREACATLAENACLVEPDGGSPTPDEAELCGYTAKLIRARGDLPRAQETRGSDQDG